MADMEGKTLLHQTGDGNVTVDVAELMADDETLMSMADWLGETDRFLTNNGSSGIRVGGQNTSP
ncbi:MAG: hypothetical protein LBP95_00925 [Deltaproteobacteria bacterium]|jgi:hypothetical protein|nr:hypothetical protein [Deltaproteobacteria bacterium]